MNVNREDLAPPFGESSFAGRIVAGEIVAGEIVAVAHGARTIRQGCVSSEPEPQVNA